MQSIEVLVQIAGAVALLLFGLSLIRSGTDEAFGMRMRMVLGAGTRGGLRSFLAGLIATLGLQSSTATALLTASFVSREMIASRMAQIVLLGANVGTALTALIVSAGVTAISPVLVLIGNVLRHWKSAVWSGLGVALIGIGLMLMSVFFLEQATAPLRTSPELAAFLPILSSAPLIAFAMTAAIAVLCSSSLAAVLLILPLALPADLALVMVLGANLGGAIPAVVATLGQGVAARRLTIGNLVVRATGCALVFPFAGEAGHMLSALLPSNIGLAVGAHLAFNITLAAAAYPFAGAVTRMMERFIPDREPAEQIESQWLDDAGLGTPSLALSGASREALAIGDMVERMLNRSSLAFRKSDTSHLAEVVELENRVDKRQQDVKHYLSRLGNTATDEQRRRSINILDYVINLEHIGDIIEKGLLPEVRKKVVLRLRFSEEGYQELEDLFLMTQENLRMAQSVFMTGDRDMARRLVELKVDIRNFERQSSQRHLMRLRDGTAESRETSSLHLDILRDLKRINAHAVSVAYPILHEEGLLFESRLRSTEPK